MTLEEAIEILTQLSEPPEIIFHSEDIKAVQLGIEALKRIAKEREFPHIHNGTWLLGETQE